MQDLDREVEHALMRDRRGKKRGNEIDFLCPSHDNTQPGPAGWNRRNHGWNCMVCGTGGTTRELAELLGIHVETAREVAVKAKEVARYTYRDEAGAVVFTKIKNQKDDIPPFKIVPSGQHMVLYRLPELLASAGRVYLPEGEKDAENVARLGLNATTWPEGAQGKSANWRKGMAPPKQKWKPEYNGYFAGREVIILADNDEPGELASVHIAAQLANVARKVAIVRLPDLPPKGDVSDWLLAGGTREQLEAFADAAEEFVPEAEPVGLAAYPRTDAGNGEAFAEMHGAKVRFDHARQRWLVWDRHFWRPDPDGHVTRLAKQMARERRRAAADLTESQGEALMKWAYQSESAAKIAATLALARTEPPIADAGLGWDANPLLICTVTGVVNLTTGKRQDGRPVDRITMNTNIPYDPDAQCPRWMQFLEEVFLGDPDVIAFVRRAVGYSITGMVSERVWFLGYGSGANGKSTFLNVLGRLSGDYAADTPADTLCAPGSLSAGAATPNLAILQGKRAVTCNETEELAKINSGRVKYLTGNNPVTARPLYGKPITFNPQFKLWLATNHLPKVDDDSDGYWDRVRLVPFNARFEGETRDLDLERKLDAELPGILAWAVRGAVEWHKSGLNPPTSVMMATWNYRQASDPLGEFIADCCVVEDSVRATMGQLYEAYLAHGRTNGMRDRDMLGAKTFGRRVAERFHLSRGHGGVRWYVGIALKAENGENGVVASPARFTGDAPDRDPVTFPARSLVWGEVSEKGSPASPASPAENMAECECDIDECGPTVEPAWREDDDGLHCNTHHPRASDNNSERT